MKRLLALTFLLIVLAVSFSFAQTKDTLKWREVY